MTRKFCDVCDKLAIQDDLDLVSTMAIPSKERWNRKSVTASVHFRQQEGDREEMLTVHLCPECRTKLINELLRASVVPVPV